MLWPHRQTLLQCLLAVTLAAPASAASFMRLPLSNAWDISADGLTVVGSIRGAPARWTAAGGVELLPVPLGSTGGAARAVSADGSVAVGVTYAPEVAPRWGPSGVEVLSLASSAAYGVSADASVVVGVSKSRPVRWDVGGGEVPLPGTTGGGALGATPDGSQIVGWAWVSPGFEAVEWTGGGMTVLANLGGGSAARAIASDGRTIVGRVAPFGSGAKHLAALWRGGDLTTLGTIPGTYQSDAWDVSGDGSIVVGFAGVSLFQGKRAVIWDESSGMRDIKQELEDVHGLDLGEWNLEVATGISRDGTIIVGNGNPSVGRIGSWIAVLPRPPEPIIPVEVDIKPGSDPNSINPSLVGVLSVAILGSDTFDVMDVDETTLAFGPDGAWFDHSQGPHFEDVNGDGLMDLMAHYRIEETGIPFGALEACITGELFDYSAFEGCDAVRTVPDMDGDALLDVEEAAIGTDALNPDTDADGFDDGQEVLLMGTDPLDPLDPTPDPVPEPTARLVILAGVALLGLLQRRRMDKRRH
jgi:uncharacterized membrane protein